MGTLPVTAKELSLSELVERRVTKYTEMRFCYGLYTILVATLTAVPVPLVLAALGQSRALGGEYLLLIACASGALSAWFFYRYFVMPRLREEKAHLNKDVLHDLVSADPTQRLLFDVNSAQTTYEGLIDEALVSARELEDLDEPPEHIP